MPSNDLLTSITLSQPLEARTVHLDSQPYIVPVWQTVDGQVQGEEDGAENKYSDMAHMCLAMPASSHPVPLHVRSLAMDTAGDKEQVDYNDGGTIHGHNKASFLQRIFTPSSHASIIEVIVQSGLCALSRN